MAAKTRELVTRWCAAEGLNPGAPADAKLLGDVEWAVELHPAPSRSVTIMQRSSNPDRIEISAGLKMAAAHVAAFKALDEGQRRRFIFYLRRDAMLLGVLYQGIGDPFETVRYTRRVYVNALTKTSFMAAFYDVANAVILAKDFVQVHLGPGHSEGSGTDVEPGGPFGDFLGGLDLTDI